MASKQTTPLPWLRLYNDVLHDPKVQQLAPALFKYWINLLCLASRQKVRGTLPSLATVAFELRIEPKDGRNVTDRTQQMIDTFIDHELIDDHGDYYVIHNWHNRQFESDNSSARVADLRERERAKKIAAQQGKPLIDPFIDDGNVTDNDDSNVTCNTKIALHVTPPDTDTDTDTESDTDSVFVPNTQRATRRAVRAKTEKPKPKKCPPVSALIASVEKWADGKGYDAPTVALHAERFANYCAANGKTYKDYSRALQNWITSPYNATQPPRPGGGARRGRLDANDEADEAIRILRQKRGAASPLDYPDAIDVPFSGAHNVGMLPHGEK